MQLNKGCFFKRKNGNFRYSSAQSSVNWLNQEMHTDNKNISYTEFSKLFLKNKYLEMSSSGRNKSVEELYTFKRLTALLRQLLIIKGRQFEDISRSLEDLRQFPAQQIFEFLLTYSKKKSNMPDLKKKYNSNPQEFKLSVNNLNLRGKQIKFSRNSRNSTENTKHSFIREGCLSNFSYNNKGFPNEQTQLKNNFYSFNRSNKTDINIYERENYLMKPFATNERKNTQSNNLLKNCINQGCVRSNKKNISHIYKNAKFSIETLQNFCMIHSVYFSGRYHLGLMMRFLGLSNQDLSENRFSLFFHSNLWNN